MQTCPNNRYACETPPCRGKEPQDIFSRCQDAIYGSDFCPLEGSSKLKLYRCSKDLTRWFAFDSKTGWVMFPAELGGWHKRKAATRIAQNDMSEVPLRLGFNTGIPGAPISSTLSTVPLKSKTKLGPYATKRRKYIGEALQKTVLVLENGHHP